MKSPKTKVNSRKTKILRLVMVFSGLILISVAFVAFWSYQYGWPPSKCDFKSDEQYVLNGIHNPFTYTPRGTCLWEEVKKTASPDIRLCYKKGYPKVDYGSSRRCALGIAEKTRDYAVCQKMLTLTKSTFEQWGCMGKVARVRFDDIKICDSAPNEDQKKWCREVYTGKDALYVIN